MYWHIDTDIVGLLVTCVLYYYTVKLLPADKLSERNKGFVWCLRCGMVMMAIDIAASVVMEVPTTRFVYHALMTLYLLVLDMVIASWFLYSLTILYHDDKEKQRRASIAVAVPYAVYMLCALSNPWTELFYSLGPKLEYTRNAAFLPIVVGLFAAYAAMLLWLIVLRRKHIPQGYPWKILFLTPLILAVAIPVQLLNAGWLMLMPAYALCLLLAFLFFHNQRVRNERAQLKQLTETVEHFACGVAICEIDRERNLKVVYLSRGYSVIFEEDSARLGERYGQDLYAGIHPDDRERVRSATENYLQNLQNYELSYRYTTASGNLKWINAKMEIVRRPDGTATSYSTYTDMTEQYKAEQQLRENEQMLEYATEQAGLRYWKYDAAADSLYPDAHNQQEYGLPPVMEHFSTQWLHGEHIHPDYVDVYRDACRRIKAGERQVVFEVQCYATDRSLHWFRYCLSNLYDQNGDAAIAVGTSMRIDGEKELSAKYELEKKRASLDMENLLAHAVFNLSTGETLEYVYRNRTMVPLEDRTTFEYGQSNASLLIDEEERARFLALNNAEALLERFARGETEFKLDYRRRLPDGDVRWVRSTMRLVRDPRGGDVLLFEYWFDIEEEKMLGLMYRSIASDNYDYVARIDGRTKHFVVFPKAGLTYRMPPSSGADADEVSMRIYNECVVPEDREQAVQNTLVENIRHNLRERGRFQFTYRELQPEGSVRYKKITQYYIDSQREIIAMLREDVTELIREEAEKNKLLADALSAANQASEAKSQFLSRVSHELRTPLNAIIGFMELARDANEREIESYLINSDIAAKQLLSIINDVLDVSSIESGKMRIAHVPFDFKHLIHSITNIFVVQCRQKGLSYETRLVTPVDEWLIGDRLRVNQILLNLLSNAVKFTTEGHIWLTVRQHEALNGKVFIRFEVSDTGCGMSADMQARLFKPFEQENAVVAQKHGGNGLGLSIVGSLVHMMGGVIRAESQPGAGTTFILDLPFTKSESELALEPLDSVDGLHVLAVDDEPAEREYISIVLKRVGVHHACVENGSAALAELDRASAEGDAYNICLVDWKMPDMNGIEIVRRIREKYGKNLIVIVVSAYEHYQADESATAAGANMFITKPLFQSSLFDLFATLTNGRISKQDSAPVKRDFSKRRILLAEDNMMNRTIAQGLLTKKFGVKCECAEDGQSAVSMFLAAEPGYYDVILMDIQMPNMDGYEAAHTIRASSHPDAKAVQIIALTANAFNEDIAKSLSNGMNGHVSKPIDPAVLAAALDKAFAERSRGAEPAD